MPTVGNTPRPAYVYDSETDTWIPIGVGPHTHDYVDKTLVDAKGDLLVGSAADTLSKLTVGSADQVLTVDSSTTTGLKWATPSSGGLTLIQETVASSSTGINFTSIAGTYKQLMLVWDGCYHSASTTGFITRLNNDSSAIYDYWHIRANVTGSTVNLGSGGVNNNAIAQYTFNYDDTGNGNDVVAQGYILIDNYASTTKWKTYTFTYRWQSSGTTYLSVGNGRYRSTSAVTSVDIVRNTGSGTLNNIANTSIRLYGVA